MNNLKSYHVAVEEIVIDHYAVKATSEEEAKQNVLDMKQCMKADTNTITNFHVEELDF